MYQREPSPACRGLIAEINERDARTPPRPGLRSGTIMFRRGVASRRELRECVHVSLRRDRGVSDAATRRFMGAAGHFLAGGGWLENFAWLGVLFRLVIDG